MFRKFKYSKLLAWFAICTCIATFSVALAFPAHAAPTSEGIAAASLICEPYRAVALNSAPKDLSELQRRIRALNGIGRFWSRDYHFGAERPVVSAEMEYRLAASDAIIAWAPSKPDDIDAGCPWVARSAAIWSVLSDAREIGGNSESGRTIDASRLEKAIDTLIDSCGIAPDRNGCSRGEGRILKARLLATVGTFRDTLFHQAITAHAKERLSVLCPSSDWTTCARAEIAKVLAEAQGSGPTIDSIEAWAVLAEMDASNTDGMDARRADMAMLAIRLYLEAQPEADQRSDDADEPSLFSRRLLPIFQLVADSVYDRRLAGGADARALARDWNFIGTMLAYGELARRAQIETTISGACDPQAKALATSDLRPKETVLYPVVGRKRTYLLVGQAMPSSNPARGWSFTLAPEGTDAIALGRLATDLLVRMQFVSDKYDEAGVRREWGLAQSYELYDRLVRPALKPSEKPQEGAVAPVLIVFPDPLLRNIPWAALTTEGELQYSGETEPRVHYLIEDYAIAVEPALAYVAADAAAPRRGRLLAASLSTVAQPEKVMLTDARFASALPSGSAGAVNRDGFPNTPDIAALSRRWRRDPAFLLSLEGKDQSELIPLQFLRERALQGEDFTETKLTDALSSAQDVTVLLIASHAAFRPKPEFMTWDSKVLPLESLAAGVRRAAVRANAIELLILGSCEGSAGDPGELGLAGGALKSGAKSTLGSVIRIESSRVFRLLFPLVDYLDPAGIDPPAKSTSENGSEVQFSARSAFLTTYYSADAASKNVAAPAQALRQTQLAALKDEELNSPATWGSLMVMGNWR